jgi:hypothetical protein
MIIKIRIQNKLEKEWERNWKNKYTINLDWMMKLKTNRIFTKKVKKK